MVTNKVRCLFEQLYKLLCSLFCVDFVYDMGDAVVGIRYKCSAHGAHIFASGHFLFLPYAECLVDFGGFIAKQDERQLMFLGKLHVTCRGILANAYYGIAHGCELLVAVGKRAGLSRASGGCL